MLMDDASAPARYRWYIEPVGGAGESPGWRKIECFLLAPQSLAGVEAAHSQLRGPPAAKSDLVQGNIFSLRPCLRFRRPSHMLWNEVGRQTKRVVICPHCVAIDLLLLAVGFLEGTASSKEMPACSIKRKVPRARPPRRFNCQQKTPSKTGWMISSYTQVTWTEHVPSHDEAG